MPDEPSPPSASDFGRGTPLRSLPPCASCPRRLGPSPCPVGPGDAHSQTHVVGGALPHTTALFYPTRASRRSFQPQRRSRCSNAFLGPSPPPPPSKQRVWHARGGPRRTALRTPPGRHVATAVASAAVMATATAAGRAPLAWLPEAWVAVGGVRRRGDGGRGCGRGRAPDTALDCFLLRAGTAAVAPRAVDDAVRASEPALPALCRVQTAAWADERVPLRATIPRCWAGSGNRFV